MRKVLASTNFLTRLDKSDRLLVILQQLLIKYLRKFNNLFHRVFDNSRYLENLCSKQFRRGSCLAVVCRDESTQIKVEITFLEK